MSWSKRIRQFHRWVSVVFTVGVIINTAAVSTGNYAAWVGLLAGLPLLLLMFSGLYLFALPYYGKRRGGGAA